ncbi:MAG: hypothetical protein QNJ09_18715 [Paracoccaceae bacterium]|nr:hypothetical protein [Paracoccaceae bacterium]
MSSYILLWQGSCSPAQNTEKISVPKGKVVYLTRPPQFHDVGIEVTNCTQKVTYLMEAGGQGNTIRISAEDKDVLCFTARTSNKINSVLIDVKSRR